MDNIDLVIEKMQVHHVEQIFAIDDESFEIPWSKREMVKELSNNLGIYIVAKNGINNSILGYAGMWHIINEGSITCIAVRSEHRHMGIGSKLLKTLIKIAEDNDMIELQLEVRSMNWKAIDMYKKFNFKIVGCRRDYYNYPKDDAILMTKIIHS